MPTNSNWKRQVLNTLFNWRWWLVLPYVVALTPFVLIMAGLEKLVEWNQDLVPYLMAPVTWVRRNFK